MCSAEMRRRLARVAATLANRSVLAALATRAGAARSVRGRARHAGATAVVLAGVELDAQRLSADLGRGDPAEGGGGELTGDLDGGEGVVDVDPAEILAVQPTLGGDRADDAAGSNAVGVADGHPVALADGIATTRAATLGGATVAIEPVTSKRPPERSSRSGANDAVPDVLGPLAVVAGGQCEQGGREFVCGQILLGQEDGDGLAVVVQRSAGEAFDGLRQHLGGLVRSHIGGGLAG